MRKTIFAALVVVLLVSVFALANAETMYVSKEHVRMRARPSLDGEIVGHREIGEAVDVVAINDEGWATLGNGYYMKADCLMTKEEAEAIQKLTMYVTGVGVRERRTPDASVSDNIIAKHQAGEAITVTGEATNGWYQTTAGGYISADFLSTNYDDVYEHLGNEYEDVIIVSISRQNARFYHFGRVFESDVVTGMFGKYNTPTGLHKVTRKVAGFYMNGNKDTYVEHALYFKEGYAIHDADHFPWRTIYGGQEYKTNGSHGCVNTPASFSEICYKYANIDCTYVIIIL